ncbi:MAG: T9SS type A sorting domain-containing protein, partial [Calditrichia bacterium]
FSMSVVTPPAAVSLLLPAPAAQVDPDSAQFVWRSAGADVQKYCLQVALDSLFAASITDSAISDTGAFVTSLGANETYWWRVRAKNSAGWGEYSPPRRFETVVTGINNPAGMIHKFTLDQNFPNPFNPQTRINYTLPGRLRVRLTIFNSLGQAVAEPVNEMQSAGKHSVSFRADDLPSGVYYCRLSCGKKRTAVRRMLLLK